MRLIAIASSIVLIPLLAAPSRGQEGIVPVGEEFDVSGFATHTHLRSVCATPSGGFVVARSQGVQKSNVVVKRFDNRGFALGADFVVNTYLAGYAVDPDVACGSNGGFLVVWTDRVPLDVEHDGVLDDDILARGFNSNGAALGEPFRVNALTDGNQDSAAVCAQPNGQYAVIWNDRARDAIDTRRVSATGSAGNVMRVATNPRPLQPPDVACAPNGNYLALWGEFPSQELNDEVVGRLFSAAGLPLGESFFVNSTTSQDQGYPTACTSPDSGFIVAWRHARSVGGDGSIRARRLAFDGSAADDDFEVSPLGRNRAELTCGARNHFVVTTRTGDGVNDTLYAQAVNGDGDLLGAETVVHSGTAGLDELAPPLAGDGAGRFVVVWPEAVAGAQALRGRFFQVEGVTTTTTLVPDPAVCGDAAESGGVDDVDILDALAVLRGAVGTGPCEPCRCDVDSSGAVTVQDALLVLSFVADLPVVLDCPPCT